MGTYSTHVYILKYKNENLKCLLSKNGIIKN